MFGSYITSIIIELIQLWIMSFFRNKNAVCVAHLLPTVDETDPQSRTQKALVGGTMGYWVTSGATVFKKQNMEKW